MTEGMAFSILNIPKTTNEKSIKKAYSTLLKINPPEDDPYAYQQLREAYDCALSYAKNAKSTNEYTPINFEPIEKLSQENQKIEFIKENFENKTNRNTSSRHNRLDLDDSSSKQNTKPKLNNETKKENLYNQESFQNLKKDYEKEFLEEFSREQDFLYKTKTIDENLTSNANGGFLYKFLKTRVIVIFLFILFIPIFILGYNSNKNNESSKDKFELTSSQQQLVSDLTTKNGYLSEARINYTLYKDQIIETNTYISSAQGGISLSIPGVLVDSSMVDDMKSLNFDMGKIFFLNGGNIPTILICNSSDDLTKLSYDNEIEYSKITITNYNTWPDIYFLMDDYYKDNLFTDYSLQIIDLRD